MIAKFDHRPMLTAALALFTIVLVLVVVNLAALLITAPPVTTSPSESGGNPGAVVMGTSENYGEEWNNYGHDFDQPQPAKTGNGADSVIDRHTEVVAAYGDNR